MNYANFLIQIKNAQAAGKQTVQAPFSSLNYEIARILVAQKYLKSAEKTESDEKNYINIVLRYKNGKPVIDDIKIISKPGRRVYRGYGKLRLVRQGFGTAVISTSKGLMTNKEARKNKMGGEYLFEIYQ